MNLSILPARSQPRGTFHDNGDYCTTSVRRRGHRSRFLRFRVSPDITSQEFSTFGDKLTNNTQLAESQPTKPTNRRYVIRAFTGATTYAIRIYQYGEDPDALVMVDFGEPEAEFPKDHVETVRFLRANGRLILANKLVTMLQDVEEDPDGIAVNIVSLRDMARLIVERKDFADPSISPDRLGVVHAQWRIVRDGLLVMSFLGYGEVLLIAQADESPDQEELDVSERGQTQDILRKHGHLVPLCN